MKKVIWWRIVIAAFVLEMLYGLFLVFLLGAAEEAYTARGIACVFAFMMIGGLWIGWKAAWRPMLHAAMPQRFSRAVVARKKWPQNLLSEH